MDREEIHHKMSKKVAQLTKVIFHLNTRNDEADQHLAATTESYEQEVEQILREANTKVQQAAKIVEKSRGENAATQVDKLRRHYEEEKRQGLSELQDLRSSLSGREQKNNSMWTDKMKQMSADMLSIKQQCTQQASTFKNALKTAEEQYSSRLAELTSQHKVELESAATAHEEALRLKMQERADAEAERLAELQSSFDQQLNDKSKQLSVQEEKIASLEAELRECRTRLEASLLDSGSALQEVSAARERLATELQQARAEIARLEQCCVEQSATVQQRDDEIASLQNASRRGEEERKNLQAEVDDLRKRLTDSQTEISKLQGENDSLQAKLKRDREALEKACGSDRALLEDRIRDLEDRQRELLAQLEARKVSEENLRVAEATARERIQALEVELEGLKADLLRLREDSSSAHADAVSKWQGEKDSLQSALDKERALVQQLQRSIEELTAEMQRRLEEATSGGSRELQEQQAAHAAALEALKRQHSQQLLEETSQLRKDHATELQGCKDQLQGEITILKEQLRQLELQVESGSSGLQERIKEIEELRQSLKAREADLQRVTQEGLERQRELTREKEGLERELERLREEAQTRERQHEADLQRLRSRLEGDVSQSEESHRQELERLRKELEAKLEAKDRDFGQERTRLEGKIRDLEQRMAELESAKHDAGSELERLRAEMRRQVEEAKMEGVSMVQRLTAEHQKTMTEVYAQHSEAITQLRETLSKSHQERIDDLRGKHEAKTAEMKSSQEAQIRDAVAAHEKATEAMSGQHRAAVETLQEGARREAERQAAELSKSEAALKAESDQHAKEKENSRQVQGRLVEAQSSVDELIAKAHAAEKTHEEALHRKEEDFAKEKRNIKGQHKAETEQLLEVQLRETAELKEQFDRARELQDMQIDMLQKRLQELQELYDNRPSRPEDLERIAGLEADVQEKMEMVNKLVEEMRFYKLELVNREQNYNKVFGATPTVGVMNPIASKRNSSNGAAPQMRIVQQPGAGMCGMNMNLPPLGGMVSSSNLAGGHGPPPTMPRKSIQKGPSSGSLPPRQLQAH